jgi:DNA-directed RNA polymerase subunit RPC12/RpoP
MYICNKCKRKFEGDAVFKNGAGEFCRQCKEFIHKRAAEVQRQRNAERKGYCVWCGKKIINELVQRGFEDENVCKDCRNHRDWMLKAIRFSDRVALYVARTESREGPLREARKNIPPPSDVVKDVSNDALARLDRLELAINKITCVLGA